MKSVISKWMLISGVLVILTGCGTEAGKQNLNDELGGSGATTGGFKEISGRYKASLDKYKVGKYTYYLSFEMHDVLEYKTKEDEWVKIGRRMNATLKEVEDGQEVIYAKDTVALVNGGLQCSRSLCFEGNNLIWKIWENMEDEFSPESERLTINVADLSNLTATHEVMRYLGESIQHSQPVAFKKY